MSKQTYGKLLGAIRSKGEPQKSVATAININVSTLNQKLNAKTEFSQSEMIKIENYLNLEDIESYFFCDKARYLSENKH